MNFVKKTKDSLTYYLPDSIVNEIVSETGSDRHTVDSMTVSERTEQIETGDVRLKRDYFKTPDLVLKTFSRHSHRGRVRFLISDYLVSLRSYLSLRQSKPPVTFLPLF